MRWQSRATRSPGPTWSCRTSRLGYSQCDTRGDVRSAPGWHGGCFRIVLAVVVKEVLVSAPLLRPSVHLLECPHVCGADGHLTVSDTPGGARNSTRRRWPPVPGRATVHCPMTIALQMHDGWKEPLTPGRCPLYNRFPKSRGFSSVGRAPQWHCGGHGFKSHKLHSDTPTGRHGAVAQLGERHNRTVEAGGSSPPSSTRSDNTKNVRSEIHVPWCGVPACPRQCVR